ncbi:MAG: hypothetical protein ACTSWY_05485 [Promethearchaeota archaeon]
MHKIMTEFLVKPNDKVFRRLVGKKFDRILKSKRNLLIYETVKKDIQKLVKPVVVWDRFPVRTFDNGKVVLEEGIEIGNGPVVEVLNGATEIIIGICSIGTSTEEKSRECMKNGKMFKAVLLDSIASWAVDSVRIQFLNYIKKELHIKYGYRTSIMLSPGELNWNLNDQTIIFSLLSKGAEEIGVHLNDSMMMIPIKSLTFLLGTGPNPIGREEGTDCEFCSQRDKCRYRRMRASSDDNA